MKVNDVLRRGGVTLRILAIRSNLVFINISLKRANDIGWFPIHDKEGTIKKFTINGSSDFEETDKFSYDAEIIIIVHTKEDEGCEDITENAD